MEDYFRQFLGSQVLSIDRPEDKWSSLFVFQLMKDGVRNSFTVVGGSFGAALPLDYEEVLHEGFLMSSPLLNTGRAQVPLLIHEMEAEDVRGFAHASTCYWSAVVRITIRAGPRKYVFGDLESDVCIGLWPSQQPFMGSLNISLHVKFMRDYLNLLEHLQISVVNHTSPGQLFLRVLRSNCVETVSEELLVLEVDETRICACICDIERSYVDLANLANFLIEACISGQLYVESFKTTRLEGTHGRCPGQITCICDPVPRVWKASVEITLKWGLRRIKIGQIPLGPNMSVCDIRARGLWPQTVPFYHGIV